MDFSDYLQILLALGALLLPILILPALLSTILVGSTISAAHHYRILARPSERGSHSVPTPRLGGLGAAAAFFGVFVIAANFFPYRFPPHPWAMAAIIGGAWALVGGLLDDVLELPPTWKFLFQGAAAGSAVICGLIPTLPSRIATPLAAAPVVGPWLPTLLAAAFAVIIIVFWMNAYNFMDGMDGQAALFGIYAMLGAAIPLLSFVFFRYYGAYRPSFGDIFWLGCIACVAAGALLGLLVHNYPGRDLTRKTFMGDGGSQFFGFQIAVFQIALFGSGGGPSLVHSFNIPPAAIFPPEAFCIILLPFAWVVIYTLIRRLRRGENILQAHRSHLYQRLLIAGWSHGRVLLFNAAFWITTLFIAWIYARNSQYRYLGILEPSIKWYQYGLIGSAFGLMIAYTMLVRHFEDNAAFGTRGR